MIQLDWRRYTNINKPLLTTWINTVWNIIMLRLWDFFHQKPQEALLMLDFIIISAIIKRDSAPLIVQLEFLLKYLV